MKSKSALDWLLEDDQPSVRFLTLTQLLERPLDDPEVVAAKGMITRKGWAEEILAKQDREGWWVSGESLYRPQCVRVARDESGQEWRLELFRERSELGLVGGHERLRGVSDSEMDGGHEKRRRTRGRVLSGKGTAQAGWRVPTVVPVPLPGPLLL